MSNRLDSTNTPSVRGDELELVEVCYGLASRWRTILILTMCALISVVAYLVFKPVVYQATLTALPPQRDKIQALRYPMYIAKQGVPKWGSTYWLPPMPKIPEINVSQIYSLFQEKLTSPGLQRRYAQEHDIPTKFYVSNNARTLTLIVNYDQPEKATEWVEGFAQYANKIAIREIASHLHHVIDNQVKILEHAISSIRNINDQFRIDRLAQLTEALQIAQKLNITDRIVETPLRPEDVPLYYRGTAMLSVEIEMAQNRETEYSLNSYQLRELQQWQDQLRNVSIKTKGVQAATFSALGVERIKTNSTRLMVLGIIMGLVLGMIVAFIAVLIEQHRNGIENEKASL
jgi:LPS O-antigen subunit length determinant protein (WzzB/FepE family)